MVVFWKHKRVFRQLGLQVPSQYQHWLPSLHALLPNIALFYTSWVHTPLCFLLGLVFTSIKLQHKSTKHTSLFLIQVEENVKPSEFDPITCTHHPLFPTGLTETVVTCIFNYSSLPQRFLSCKYLNRLKNPTYKAVAVWLLLSSFLKFSPQITVTSRPISPPTSLPICLIKCFTYF